MCLLEKNETGLVAMLHVLLHVKYFIGQADNTNWVEMLRFVAFCCIFTGETLSTPLFA